MSTHNAILFDLDGTLLDTAHDLTLAVNDVVQRYKPKKSFTLLEARRIVGYGSEAIFHELISEYAPHVDYEEFRSAFRQAYTDRKHESTAFFDGVVQLLEHLNTIKMPWGIVTNKTEAGAKEAVAHFAPLKMAQCVVGCDTAGQAKPSPAPLLYATEQLHLSPQECLFVGDTIIDMEAAYHAKMPVVAVDYGYGTQDILQGKFQPTAWIKSPLDILTLL